ncbi:MAG: hypothetical protein R2749_15310 [Acidimicrobiales bacterium]
MDEHVKKMYSSMLMRKAKSWFTGYNSNVEGHEEGTIRYFVYNGGAPKFVQKITEEAHAGYRRIDTRRSTGSAPVTACHLIIRGDARTARHPAQQGAGRSAPGRRRVSGVEVGRAAGLEGGHALAVLVGGHGVVDASLGVLDRLAHVEAQQIPVELLLGLRATAEGPVLVAMWRA